MTATSKAETSLTLAAPAAQPVSAPAPTPRPDSVDARPALKRCLAAWHRTFNAQMEARGGSNMDKVFAAHHADKAYCKAMPLLCSYESIRDFIACTAHGILIGAITPQQSGHILYAAQVALSSLPNEPKPQKPGPKK
jgi:hypothetical protein